MWVRRAATKEILDSASRHYPQESGGILMGYWSDSDNVVATHSIGPGPDAEHREHSFKPDHEWQAEEVARHYESSGRIETYLGDWHSHPGTQWADLSFKDRATLYRIAKYQAARAPTPIMAVVIGEPDSWHIAGWVGQAVRRLGIFPGLSVEKVIPRDESR